MNINSKEYWNNRFSINDWTEKKGREQTSFFVNLAISNFPQWFINDINKEKLSICDFGCAEGDGVKILSDYFINSKITGVDFSDDAIKCSKKNYPQNDFVVGAEDSLKESFDVVFSSNTFEHFENPFEKLSTLLKHTRKYLVLLLPFREFERIEEHLYTFNFDSFPMKLDDFNMASATIIDGAKIENSHWYDNQILVIYAANAAFKDCKFNLQSILSTNLDNLNIEINTLLKDKDILYAQTQELSNSLAQTNNKVTDLCEEKNVLNLRLDEMKKEIDKLNNVLQDKDSLINNYKLEISRVYGSKLWEILKKYKTLEEKRVIFTYIKKLVFYIYVYGVRKAASKTFRKVSSILFGKVYKGFWAIFNLKKDRPGSQIKKANQKKDKKVYIFAVVPYYDIGGGQRSAQLAKIFHKMGYDVTYLYAYESNESEKKDIYIPFEEHYYIKQYSPELLKKIKNEFLMIFEAPHTEFLPYLKIAKTVKAKTVYEHIDNWETSLGSAWFSTEIFGKFLKDVDMIVATAKLLKQRIIDFINTDASLSGCDEKVYYIPNAVDSELFDPIFRIERPLDLVLGEKTLVYYGSLWGEWFDWELVRYVAKNYPQCSINLIGDYRPIKEKIENIKDFEKNIHFLGLKKQTELPAYLKYSDIAILPFKCDEIGIYVSPLKIFEYISMNKPVLSTELPDIEGYPNVFRSNTKEAWLKYVKSDVQMEAVDAFVAKNNWYHCCNFIFDKTLKTRPNHGKISVVILNRNNMSIIGKCVESLIVHKGTYNYEIVVVDNESTDGSYEMLYERFNDQIKLIKNTKNGCSCGRNLGVSSTTCDTIVFLDSDQWAVSSKWLDAALYILNKHPEMGAVGWGAGWFDRGKATGKIADYLPNRGIDNKTLYRTDIAYLATCGMAMRRRIFESVHGFDEFYDPTCFEDTDLSLAIRNNGYEISYCPFINVLHLPHQTTNSGSAKHTELLNRNGDYFLKKWNKKNPKLLKYYI